MSIDAPIAGPAGDEAPRLGVGTRYEDLPRVFETCAGCRICADYCPLFVDLFALVEERREGGPADLVRRNIDSLLGSCYFCGRCEQACPLEFKIETIAWEHLRERREREGVSAALRRGADFLWAARWGRRLGWLLDALLRLQLVRRLLRRLAGIDPRAPLPRLARPTPSRWPARPGAAVAAEKPARKVALFAGCLGDHCRPAEGRALGEILERSGASVRLVEAPCCGLPLFAAGLADEAKGHLEASLASMTPLIDDGYEVVVVNSPCALMFQKRAARLLGEGAGEAARVLPHVHEACQYLWGLHRQGLLVRPEHGLGGRVAYHAPCASRVLGSDQAALRLLRQVPGLDVVRLDSGCCGLAGAWGLQCENYGRARAAGERHLAAPLRAAGADRLASECPQCRLQARHLVPETPTAHPIEIYREALGD